MLKFTVAKEKGSNQYYACEVGHEDVPLGKRYTDKKKALKEAAVYCGLPYKEFMHLYRKTGKEE